MLKFRLVFIPFFAALAAQAQNVRFNMAVGCSPVFLQLGGIDVTLTPSITPLTVANFMSYVNSGAYDCTIIHRSLNATNSAGVPPYIIQGGGYALNGLLPYLIPQNPPVNNEFQTSNTAGTLAMTQYAGEVDSGTDEWFFNVSDNSSSFDAGKYTVFGNVANDSGTSVVNEINNLVTWVEDFGGDSNFENLPLWTNYSCPVTTNCPLVKPDNFVFVTSIATIGTPAITAAGIADAATEQPVTSGISPGQIITLYGANFGSSTPSYLGPSTAPGTAAGLELNSAGTSVITNLEGTQVTFNGTAGPLVFTSDQQLAVVVPYEIAGQSTVSVVVSYLGGSSAPMQFSVLAATPGLLTLNESGKGDAAIVRLSDGSVISASNPASVGDTLELYAEGYGVASATTALPDGTVVGSALPLPAATTTVLIDGKSYTPIYAGGAYGYVNGVMQINLVVPQLEPGSHQIQIQVGSTTSPAGVTLETM